MRARHALLLVGMALAALPAAAQDVASRSEDVGRVVEPSPTPISWEIDFKYLEPRRIEVAVRGGREVYWYLVYTATNRSGATQTFHPTFQLVTGDLRVIDTDMGISAVVFDAIRERHKLTHPYLVHPTRAIGPIRVGSDYAVESVAIWRATDVTSTRFTIFAAGLSGEARLAPNPGYDPERPESRSFTGDDGRQREVTDNPRYFTLRKTLALEYLLPGSMNARAEAEPQLQRMRWIMR